MKIKKLGFVNTVTMPGTGSGGVMFIAQDQVGSNIAYDDKLGVFVLTKGDEQVLVPWSNVAWARVVNESVKK